MWRYKNARQKAEHEETKVGHSLNHKHKTIAGNATPRDADDLTKT